MKKAISYTRVAVDSLRSANNSIHHQGLEIQEYCMKEKIELLQSFEDVGSGSTISNRSGWKALETFLQHHNGKVNFLVVANLDRIGRKFSLVQEKVLELKTKYGVDVITTRARTRNEFELFAELNLLNIK